MPAAEEPSLVSVCGPAAVIILAAGEGTRMKASTPKVLQPVCGRPMLGHVIEAVRELEPAKLIVVTGHARRRVGAYLAEHAPEVVTVVQHRQGGTGHAVRTVTEAVGPIHGTVVVTYADTPLLRGQTLRDLVAAHVAGRVAATALTARLAEPAGYGRILRDERGSFAGIIEEADASLAQRAIDEINSGVYAYDGELLADAVKRVPTDNVKGEEYLTDVVTILRGDGHRVATAACPDPGEVLGVNDQSQLAWARRELNARLVGSWLRAGVTVVDPATTWIDVGVVLEADVRIEPGTQLEGSTTVAAGARVGPGCVLRDTTVGERCTVIQSVCESVVIGAGATVGPFAHLTGGSVPGGSVPGGASLAGGATLAEGATLAAGSRLHREGLGQ